MLFEVFGDHLFFLTRKSHKSPSAPSTYQFSDQKQQMAAEFRLNTLRMRVHRILKKKQLTSEIRCSKSRNYFVLSWKWLNCSPHLILNLDFWMCFDEKTTTSKRKLGFRKTMWWVLSSKMVKMKIAKIRQCFPTLIFKTVQRNGFCSCLVNCIPLIK